MTATPTITVYSKPDCQPCRNTKRALDRAGIPYAEKPVADRVDEFKDRGFLSSPVVVVTDADGAELRAWSGFRFDELRALAKEVG